jgi:hypothetical protein
MTCTTSPPPSQPLAPLSGCVLACTDTICRKLPPGFFIVDTESSVSQMGKQAMDEPTPILHQLGYHPMIVPVHYTHATGVGGAIPYAYAIEVPISLGGYVDTVTVHVADDDTPAILAGDFLRKLGFVLDLPRGLMRWSVVGARSVLTEVEGGHLVVDGLRNLVDCLATGSMPRLNLSKKTAIRHCIRGTTTCTFLHPKAPLHQEGSHPSLFPRRLRRRATLKIQLRSRQAAMLRSRACRILSNFSSSAGSDPTSARIAVAKLSPEQRQAPWKRMILLIFWCFRAIQTKASAIAVLGKAGYRALVSEEEEQQRRAASAQERTITRIIRGEIVGRELPASSQGSSQATVSPQLCARDDLVRRGNKEARWWTCQKCGRRWERRSLQADEELYTELLTATATCDGGAPARHRLRDGLAGSAGGRFVSTNPARTPKLVEDEYEDVYEETECTGGSCKGSITEISEGTLSDPSLEEATLEEPAVSYYPKTKSRLCRVCWRYIPKRDEEMCGDCFRLCHLACLSICECDCYTCNDCRGSHECWRNRTHRSGGCDSEGDGVASMGRSGEIVGARRDMSDPGSSDR